VIKHAKMWKHGTNGDKSLSHKSSQKTKSTALMYNNEWRITVTNSVLTAGLKSERSKLKLIETANYLFVTIHYCC
jgi:hypothetical protein